MLLVIGFNATNSTLPYLISLTVIELSAMFVDNMT